VIRKIILALIFSGMGVALIVFTEPVKRAFGSLDFAEKWFGMGGTYVFWKIVGVFFIVGAFLWLTGTIDRFIPDFILNPGVE